MVIVEAGGFPTCFGWLFVAFCWVLQLRFTFAWFLVSVFQTVKVVLHHSVPLSVILLAQTTKHLVKDSGRVSSHYLSVFPTSFAHFNSLSSLKDLWLMKRLLLGSVLVAGLTKHIISLILSISAARQGNMPYVPAGCWWTEKWDAAFFFFFPS